MYTLFIKNGIIWSMLFLTCLFFSCSNSDSFEEKKSLSISNCNFEGIKTGDIVLKRGKGKVSSMITDYFKEKVPLSHCGVVVCAPDSTFIVHSVAEGYARKDGVQTILLNDFLKDCQANYFYIVRKKTSQDLSELFASKALAYAQQNIRFDDDANNADKNEMSCTELIYWCQKEVYNSSDLTTIKIINKDVFVFNGLLDTSKYEIIKHY